MKFIHASMEFHFIKSKKGNAQYYVVKYSWDKDENHYRIRIVGPMVKWPSWTTNGQPNKTNAGRLVLKSLKE